MTTIRIGTIDYEVFLVDGLEDSEGNKLDGQIRHSESAIYLESKLEVQSQRAVLWHEIIHGILSQHGLGHHAEELCDTLAYGIMGVLKDNPKLRETCLSMSTDVQNVAVKLKNSGL